MLCVVTSSGRQQGFQKPTVFISVRSRMYLSACLCDQQKGFGGGVACESSLSSACFCENMPTVSKSWFHFPFSAVLPEESLFPVYVLACPCPSWVQGGLVQYTSLLCHRRHESLRIPPPELTVFLACFSSAEGGHQVLSQIPFMATKGQLPGSCYCPHKPGSRSHCSFHLNTELFLRSAYVCL